MSLIADARTPNDVLHTAVGFQDPPAEAHVWPGSTPGRQRSLPSDALEAQLVGVRLAARTFDHELRSALTVTLGYVDALAGDPALPEETRRRAAGAREGVRRAVAVIATLVDAVRLDEIDWGTANGTTLLVGRPQNPRPGCVPI